MDGSLPEVRIGDRERRQVDDRLQAALADGVLTLSEYDERAAGCWAARTQTDLDALTRDLPGLPHPDPPVVQPGVAAAPRPARRSGRVVGGVVAVALVIAALTGLRVVGADDGASVFGGRVVQVGPTQDQVRVGMLFGSMQVRVPDGVRVRTSGTVIFGSLNCDEACRVDGAGREIRVDANGAFGSVEIITERELTAEAAQEAAQEAEEAARDAAEDARDDREDAGDG